MTWTSGPETDRCSATTRSLHWTVLCCTWSRDLQLQPPPCLLFEYKHVVHWTNDDISSCLHYIALSIDLSTDLPLVAHTSRHSFPPAI